MSTDWVTVARSLARMVVYGDEIDWWHKSKEYRGNDQGCGGKDSDPQVIKKQPSIF